MQRLAEVAKAAIVVEGDYPELFRTQPGRGSWLADMLGRLAVRYPEVPASSSQAPANSPRSGPTASSAHQCTLPAEHRLWPHQQSGPSRLRQMISQSGLEHSIAGRPVHSLDLALQNLNLTERQHLRLEPGLIAVAGGEQVEHDPKQRMDKGSHHAGAKS
jgi:hypothetical protein